MSQKLSSTVMYGAGNDDHYLENFALHYLCRPSLLKNLSCQEFYKDFSVTVVKTRPSKHSKPGMRFIADTGFFKHPSAKKEKDGSILECRQGVVPRVPGALNVQVSQ
jgi:hypothetical protein